MSQSPLHQRHNHSSTNLTSSEFSTLSSIPDSHLHQSSSMNYTGQEQQARKGAEEPVRNGRLQFSPQRGSTGTSGSPNAQQHSPQAKKHDSSVDLAPKNTTSTNPSLHSLQCEIQLWQDAYQTAQEGHATRIKQLIQEQKGRESGMRQEIQEKWERRFDEVRRDTEVIEKEMRWMVNVMLGRMASRGDDNITDDTIPTQENSSQQQKLTSSSSHSFSESLNVILKELIHGLDTHHVTKATISSTTSHLMNDFKSRFHALLRNIQQQYEQLHVQNDRLSEVGSHQQRSGKRQEAQIEELNDSLEKTQHKLLTMQQEKAQLDLQLAQHRQQIEHLKSDNERLDSEMRQHFADSSSSTTELQKRVRQLERERDEFQSDVQDLELQLTNKTKNMDNTEQKLNDTFEKLKNEQLTNTELRDTIYNLESEIRKLQAIEDRFKDVQHQLQEESEERSTSQQTIHELHQEIDDLRAKYTQTERKLQTENDEYKRQCYEAQQLLEALRSDSKKLHSQHEEQLLHLEATYEKKISLLEKQLQNTRGDMQELQEKTTQQIASEYQGVISRLTGIISTHNQQIIKENGDPITQVASIFDNYENRIAEIQEKSFVMEASFKSRELKYEHKISELEFKVREKQAQMDDLKHDIEAAIEKMETKISNDAKIRGDERQRYKTVISVLQQQIENSGLPKSSAVAALTSPKKNSKDSNGTMEKMRLKYKRTVAKLQKEKQALELSADKLENAQQSAKKRIALLQEQNGQLKQQLQKAHERCDSLDQQMRININKDAQDIEELIQQNSVLRQEVDELKEKEVCGAPTSDALQDYSGNQQLRTQLHELSKKYKHIKDKYIRQSLRQNELQNYILNLHRTGRVSLDPHGMNAAITGGRSSLGSFSSPPQQHTGEMENLLHNSREQHQTVARYPAASSQSTSPGKASQPIPDDEEILTDESSFDETMVPRRLKHQPQKKKIKRATSQRRASETSGMTSPTTRRTSRPASASKRVSAPTLRNRPRSASSSRASSVPRKRG
eukprot:CAMPEP_0117438156 /NCGR_PEP_ID=MMETSP0759-20121206/1907_1 /TAXON_ID=63605 /ORGANISM="Percolomonas cosmopolitus, Strain WS" /LENGTH=1016 /DNA_ID=CAMNT_0005229837 /DNA_START=181 /DNA_END=3227 /DNA_ORIENTATION=-